VSDFAKKDFLHRSPCYAGKAEVIKSEGGPEDQIQEAMESCPVECIHWEE
jgi:ferredoxin